MKYLVSYTGSMLAMVDIDIEKARDSIEHMVTFWSDWEDRLAEEDGDYLRVWLKQLARFVIRSGRAPTKDEGWVAMDGRYGITLLESWEYEVENEDIEIEEVRL